MYLGAGDLWASADAPLPAATSFAYSVSHPVTPLPASVIERIVNTDGHDSDDADAFDAPHDTRVDVRIGAPRALSRSGMCNAVVSVARANDLPIPFFANLIWQESNFDVKSISRAGALGVAQYMPQTANEQGLINPFEPIHALHVAGKFLRRLQAQFGNLGLAAAAYNAGPGRVSNWMAKRGGLPGETRNYVVRITGRQAEQWTSSEFVRDPEATLMPAKAPCVEVAEAVEAQGKVVRVARLISELAAAAKTPSRDSPNDEKFDEAAWKIASAKPEWQMHALHVVRGALQNISEQKARGVGQAREQGLGQNRAGLEPDRRPDHEEGRRGIRRRPRREGCDRGHTRSPDAPHPRRVVALSIHLLPNLSTSWPGLSRPSTLTASPKKGVDARHKAGHDESCSVQTLALKRRLDLRPQLRRHLRLDAEPGLPRRDALVQQHAQARHRAVAARRRPRSAASRAGCR